MNKKTYITTTGYIFLTVTTLHLLRVLSGWQVVIGNWVVPMWLSLVAVGVAGYLAYSAIKMRK